MRAKRVLSFVLALVLLVSAAFAAPTAQAAGGKLIAITYDDGPGPYTQRLLDGLKARGVKATFFMLGQRAQSYPSTVARVYQEGHQVANHSYSHPELTSLSGSGIKNEIQTTNSFLDKGCGKGTSYLVRPPYGSMNHYTAQLVGAPLILWSVDPQDWLYRNAETVKNRIVSASFDGAIVLVHDIHSTTVDGSLAAIDWLKAQGYEFVTVNELFRRRGRSLANGGSYSASRPNGTDLGPVKTPEVSVTPENGRLRVSITAQQGAGIYYTLDGSDITQTAARYTGPFLADSPCKIKAVAAYNLNGSRSETVEKIFTKPAASTPAILVEEGLLTITCESPGATVYFSYTGASYSGGNQIYTQPIPIEPGTEIAAYAGGENYLNSGRVQAMYSARGTFFQDVLPKSWYYEPMDWAAASGYMNGVGQGWFQPGGQVTRGQLAAFLYRHAGSPAIETDPVGLFPDVALDRFYTTPVAWAWEQGFVQGYGDGSFQPDRPVTRQEMCAVVFGYLRSLMGGVPQTQPLDYTDRDQIAPWAYDAVASLTALGLVNGTDGAFNPSGTTTRAQAATVLMRVTELVESLDEDPGDNGPSPSPDEPKPEEPSQPEPPDTPSESGGEGTVALQAPKAKGQGLG